jgi:hypothetical protein
MLLAMLSHCRSKVNDSLRNEPQTPRNGLGAFFHGQGMSFQSAHIGRGISQAKAVKGDRNIVEHIHDIRRFKVAIRDIRGHEDTYPYNTGFSAFLAMIKLQYLHKYLIFLYLLANY